MTIIEDYLKLTIEYKKQYGEKTLILMQVGSFFECYAILDKTNNIYSGSNIQEFSDINDLVIANKSAFHKGQNVVMAGFGLAQLEKYIKRMQENDYTIVVYTQDSNSKNTSRSLSCIYSPGSYFSNDSNELTNVTSCIWIHYSASNNLVNEKITIGLSSIDIYTGFSNTLEYNIDSSLSKGGAISIFDELENYISINNPSECIIISNKKFEILDDIINCKKHYYDYDFDAVSNISKQKYQCEIINNFFEPKTFQDIFNEFNISSQSYCFLIQFLHKHNPSLIKKIKLPSFDNCNTKLNLANHSLKQLNIVSDNRYSGKFSCVLNLLNNCITNMGKRAFKQIILSPSINFNYLKKEYEITEYILNKSLWKEIRNYLLNVKDLSKIYRKLILGKLSPKDFWIIDSTFNFINKIYLYISNDHILTDYINHENISFSITEIKEYINFNLNLEFCKQLDDISLEKISLYNLSQLNLFSSNYDSDVLNLSYKNFKEAYANLDKIRISLDNTIKSSDNSNRSSNGGDIDFIKIHESPKSEPMLVGTTKRLNILKKVEDFVGTNNIQIKNHNGNNSYVTSDEISRLCKSILKYKEDYIKNVQNEFKKFSNNFIEKYENSINFVIDYVTKIDLLQNKCYIADKFNYSKPNIIDSEDSFVDFIELRHPLIENLNLNELYVTNDLKFQDNNKSYLLYGTNAVGKTSFIKSIGISIIMAQAGLFVPAKIFNFSIYKSIYTRILGNDNLFKGLSTFAVEMTELRNILKTSCKNSLVLGDELCSGTESTSATSIFSAGIKYLVNKNVSLIFATHFHEILKFSEIKFLIDSKLIHILHLSVIYDNSKNKLIYDRKLKQGSGSNIYGLEVCKSLNLPDDFLEIAHDIRKNNFYDGFSDMQKFSVYNSTKLKGKCQICKLAEGQEVHHLIYQKNADKHIKNHKANLINICEKCHDLIHKENSILKIYKTSNGYEII